MTCDLVPMRAKQQSGQEVWGGVFSQSETSYYKYPDDWCFRSTEEAPRNPEYREDLHLNLSNRNMEVVMSALDYEIPPDGYLVEIQEFIRATTAWLREHIDRSSANVESKESNGGQYFEGGRKTGYVNEKIHRAAFIAREGLERGATHVFIG